MSTHELANLLDHLKIGLGSSFKADGGKAFEEASAAFRELPDQPLRKLAEQLKNSGSQSTPARRGRVPAVDVAELADRIRAARIGESYGDDLIQQISDLKNASLREILKAFDQKTTTKTEDNLARVLSLLKPQLNGSHTPPTSPSEADQRHVNEGVELFRRLQNTRGISISDVRSQFEVVRGYSKSAVEELSRQLGYTPAGSREEIVDRFLSNLEGIKMSQARMDTILNE